jgi:hypothetical protein
VTAYQGGQKNRNGKTTAVLFLPCFLLVLQNELVEYENEPVEVQNFKKIINRFTLNIENIP